MIIRYIEILRTPQLKIFYLHLQRYTLFTIKFVCLEFFNINIYK